MSHTTPNDRWAKAYNAGAAAGYKQAEARILELEEQAERCECDKHDWEQAGGRIKDLETRLEAVKALCEREIASDYAEYATVLAQDVLRAAEGKP